MQKDAELDGWKNKYLNLEKIAAEIKAENAQIDGLKAKIATQQQELSTQKVRLQDRADKIKELEDAVSQLQADLAHADGLAMDKQDLEE